MYGYGTLNVPCAGRAERSRSTGQAWTGLPSSCGRVNGTCRPGRKTLLTVSETVRSVVAVERPSNRNSVRLKGVKPAASGRTYLNARQMSRFDEELTSVCLRI